MATYGTPGRVTTKLVKTTAGDHGPKTMTLAFVFNDDHGKPLIEVNIKSMDKSKPMHYMVKNGCVYPALQDGTKFAICFFSVGDGYEKAKINVSLNGVEFSKTIGGVKQRADHIMHIGDDRKNKVCGTVSNFLDGDRKEFFAVDSKSKDVEGIVTNDDPNNGLIRISFIQITKKQMFRDEGYYAVSRGTQPVYRGAPQPVYHGEERCRGGSSKSAAFSQGAIVAGGESGAQLSSATMTGVDQPSLPGYVEFRHVIYDPEKTDPVVANKYMSVHAVHGSAPPLI